MASYCGEATTFRKYNPRGQVLEFASPDGAVTTLIYVARGWLTLHGHLPAGGNLQVTAYEYDAAGQLKKATLPDLSFVTFSYDDAHRLKARRSVARLRRHRSSANSRPWPAGSSSTHAGC